MTFLNRTSSDDADFRDLVALLDEDLKQRDGDEHAFYAQFNSIENIRHVIVCYVDDKSIGCGAFKVCDPQKVEIKRMYVLPGYRGHGMGLGILKELELWAAELNFPECILETGKNNPEAIRLYQSRILSV